MELTRHPLAANNLLFGVSNFFVLPLPAVWELVRGPFEPEVDRQTRRDEISWVQEGHAMYLLVHRAYRATVELRIAIRPRPAAPRTPMRPLDRDMAPRQMPIGGHGATYQLREQLRGWWPRKRVNTLSLAFSCDVLGRGIALELLEEEGQEAHLREILQALSQLQCH